LTYDWEPEEEDNSDNDSLVDWDLTSSEDEEIESDGILETGEYQCSYC